MYVRWTACAPKACSSETGFDVRGDCQGARVCVCVCVCVCTSVPCGITGHIGPGTRTKASSTHTEQDLDAGIAPPNDRDKHTAVTLECVALGLGGGDAYLVWRRVRARERGSRIARKVQQD